MNNNKNDEYSNKILKEKQNFTILKQQFREADQIFNNLNNKTKILEKIYNNLLEQNKNNLYVFGLDSFKFQNKLINIEHSTMQNYYNLITNRLYCDYYKLQQIIYDYIINKIDNDKIIQKTKQNYLNKDKYDYINIYKYYDISKTNDLFNSIINMINDLNDYSYSLTKELENYTTKKKNGLNINNFIYTFEYNNILIQQQISLYLNYIDFFLKLHKKYIVRFTNRIKLMYEQVNNDIVFEDSTYTQNDDISPTNKMLDTDSDDSINEKTESFIYKINSDIEEECNKYESLQKENLNDVSFNNILIDIDVSNNKQFNSEWFTSMNDM